MYYYPDKIKKKEIDFTKGLKERNEIHICEQTEV